MDRLSELPSLPDWLPALAAPCKGAGVMPARTKKVAHGERHDHLCDLAVRLVRAGITDEATIERMLKVEYETNCEQTPPARKTEFSNLADWATGTRIAKRERARATPRVLTLGNAGLRRRQ
jgi:hypothetical protein